MNDEAGRHFVDTSVLVYAHDRSAEVKHVRAQALLRHLWSSRQGCLSLQVLQEFYVTITRKIAHPLPPEAAAQLIADLKAWQVHLPDVDDVLGAIALQERYRISFWDAMIIYSAWQLDCTVIWSEDLNAEQYYQGVRVVNPFISE